MKSFENLSIREKIGQTMIFRSIEIEKLREKLGSLEDVFERYPIGGVFIGSEVIKNVENRFEEARNLIKGYQDASRIPLVICGDFESGCGASLKGMTEFSSIMGVAATESEGLAYGFGKGLALEAGSIGIHWAFGPVSDLNINPKNQATNVRSAGDNPEKVLRVLRSIVKGMQENGLSATAKHFPGDGIDWRNPHVATGCINLSKEAWYQKHGKIFKALIDEGVDTIMTGHIAFPAFQKERMYGNPFPCTLSKELTTDLLKDEMGFEGVVVSDALNMGGYLEWYEDEMDAHVKCFESGCDMLLWVPFEYLDRIEKEINNGNILMDRLNDACAKVFELKKNRGVFSKENYGFFDLTSKQTEEIRNTTVSIAEGSIALVRDRNNMLPLSKDKIKRVLYIAATVSGSRSRMGFLKEELEKRGIEVEMRDVLRIYEFCEIADDFDLVIFGFSNRGYGVVDFASHGLLSQRILWSALSYAKLKTIIISFGTPYIHNEYFKNAPVCINAYFDTQEIQSAAIKALFGEIPFKGTIPVDCSNI